MGDYSYYDDFEDVHNFEKRVRYFFPFVGDKLIIGKFCAIASGVTFIMNGANHLTDTVSSYPFALFGGGWEGAMAVKSYPSKGNTVIGNEVWIGYNATIMPGVQVGNRAIIGANATVTRNVAPYSVVGGNPARELKKRFPEERIREFLELKWWDRDIEKITKNVDQLTGRDIEDLVGKK